MVIAETATGSGFAYWNNMPFAVPFYLNNCSSKWIYQRGGYVKRYRALSWVLAAVLLFVPTAGMAVGAPANLPKIEYSGTYEFLTSAENQIFEKINDLRRNPGKYKLENGTLVSSQYPKAATLQRSELITGVARYKSLYMIAYNDFNHLYTKGPLAGVGKGNVRELVFFNTPYWAENIAYRGSTVKSKGVEYGNALFEQWLNSPGHLANMMEATPKHIGIGVVAVYDAQRNMFMVYGTQQFASSAPAALNNSLPTPLTTKGRQGSVLTGWQKKGDRWYLTDANGDALKGWQKSENKWYYLDGSGAMATGWKKIGGQWYFFKANGEMATGWQTISGIWYYFNSSGEMQTGWQKLNSSWYYFDSSGAMTTGSRTINGVNYKFASSGAMI